MLRKMNMGLKAKAKQIIIIILILIISGQILGSTNMSLFYRVHK